MQEASFIIFILISPSSIICCKGKSPEPTEPPCPEGFWKVPDGYKCTGVRYGLTDCANNGKCMNYAYVCDGKRSMRSETASNNSIEQEPDESLCTDEFCSTLVDGRTKRCPGTTRCIPPYTFFPSTDIPMGPVCAEVIKSMFKAANICIY